MIQAKLFKSYSIKHGISSIEDGDMTNKDNLEAFAKKLRVDPNNLQGVHQIHSDVVHIIDSKLTQTLDGDGLVTKNPQIALFILTADCIPVLFFDPVKKTVAVAHAGWKGLLSGVIPETIKKMKEHGCETKDILVSLGPSIRSCCYSVDQKRIDMFSAAFPAWADQLFINKEQQTFLDLQKLAFLQLTEQGIDTLHIHDVGICTKDSSEFYSYRRDGNTNRFGEMVSVISV